MLKGVIHQSVHFLLVDFLVHLVALVFHGNLLCRQAHHTETEYRHLVARSRIGAIGHLVLGHFTLGRILGILLGANTRCKSSGCNSSHSHRFEKLSS